jgi:LAGLIDADG endonuclease
MTTHLEAQWITGFIDGEGCFSIEVNKQKDRKPQIQVALTVVQSKSDEQVLYALKDYFGCGSVTDNKKDDEYEPRRMWRVKSVKHFAEKIIPFFEKHKLKTKRRIEFQRVRAICLALQQKDHEDPIKFEKMLRMADIYRIGGTMTRKLKRMPVEERQKLRYELIQLDQEYNISIE